MFNNWNSRYKATKSSPTQTGYSTPIYCMCCMYMYIYDIYIQTSFLCPVATLLVVQVNSNMTNLVRYLTTAR